MYADVYASCEQDTDIVLQQLKTVEKKPSSETFPNTFSTTFAFLRPYSSMSLIPFADKLFEQSFFPEPIVLLSV